MTKNSQHQSSVWQADLVSIVLLVVFVLVVFGLERLVQPNFNAATLMLTGVVLAIVPAIIWLGFFYRRDRMEPEPKGMVFSVFLLGGLIAAAAGIPILNGLFDVDSWLNSSIMTQIVGGILVVGFVHEFLKYAAVRFSVFGSAEYDEPIDGIIYATAAGLGYATMLNIDFVISSGGVDLGSGVVRIVITALAHASFAGVSGYFLGLEKFEKRPVWSTALGVSLAAALNGLFFYLRSALTQSGGISTSGLGGQRWLGFALTAIFAAVVTAAVSSMMQKHMDALAAEEA
jgi:RsiW-degrading membrane proteinase PrsW (M82 family)